MPGVITHQGRLYDASDAPVNGAIDERFALYDDPQATFPIWSETHSVTFDNGYFAVSLGSTVMLDVFVGAPLYLGITVGTDSEMLPRGVIQSVPYALLAGDVTGEIHPKSVWIGGVTVIGALIRRRRAGARAGGSGAHRRSRSAHAPGSRPWVVAPASGRDRHR